MARFLITTIPLVGHVNPALPIARQLVERGHEVWWYSGKTLQSKIEATGARFLPIRTGMDFSDLKNVPDSLREKRKNLKGLAQFKFDFKHFFCDSAVGQVKDLTDILREFPADVLLSDVCFLGAAWVHETGGPPWAAFGITALGIISPDTAPFGLGMRPDASTLGRLRNGVLNWVFERGLFKDVTDYMNQLRASIGLPPYQTSFFDAVVSPYLYLQGTVPAFEYPRSNLPSQVHFIGPYLPEPPADFTPPVWWDVKRGKPVIHVTQGTVATDADDLIVPTLQALADEDVLVVAATGGEPIENIKAPLPANARLERFIPYYHLLPHVDVMVTNGGYNGVQAALAHGVPLVAAGQTEEKPEICTRIEWAGVGINLKTKTPTSTQLKNAVKKILESPHYRQKAQLIQADITRYDTPSLSAKLLEQLAVTKQPVFVSS
ncbi:MAG: glycosyltransferase [Symplocastrum torsivum CPER-KK1]|jgi:UDP:flavonoid glycosyltransferase YjiC (YdhE family)|uniref:Glycosyltransferase n=1 Tax=Symplocastrum torsivum CPER-KK1 TaxID=450513 RepID=A0A951PPS9_9CYAN|nr:glycosyltransferase [Symplocastrum torsivum CPER-KK1]